MSTRFSKLAEDIPRKCSKIQRSKRIYVDSRKGNDQYSGTSIQPLATLSAAAKLCQDKDTIIKVRTGIGYIVTTNVIIIGNWKFASGTQVYLGKGGNYLEKCGQLIGRNIYGRADFILNNCHPFILGTISRHQRFEFNTITGTVLAPVFMVDSEIASSLDIIGNSVRVTKGAVLYWNRNSESMLKQVFIQINNISTDLLYIEEDKNLNRSVSTRPDLSRLDLIRPDLSRSDLVRPSIIWNGATLNLTIEPKHAIHIQTVFSDLELRIDSILNFHGVISMRTESQIKIYNTIIKDSIQIIDSNNRGQVVFHNVIISGAINALLHQLNPYLIHSNTLLEVDPTTISLQLTTS